MQPADSRSRSTDALTFVRVPVVAKVFQDGTDSAWRMFLWHLSVRLHVMVGSPVESGGRSDDTLTLVRVPEPVRL